MNKNDNSMTFPSLKGKLLLSMPHMDDTRFDKAVIYICEHDENGAMGIVINRVMPGLAFGELLEQFKIKSDIEVDPALLARPVFMGGPVDTQRGFLLHSKDFMTPETISIGPMRITATLSALKALVKGYGPRQHLFALGYAGWEAGQLEAEILDNVWLTADSNLEDIFNADKTLLWQKTMSTIGIDPTRLSDFSGHA